jgi:hypothetical protein
VDDERRDAETGPPEWQPPTAAGPETPWSSPGDEQHSTYQPAGRTPGTATASLVLGILGLVLCPIICSVLAIVYGHQARQEIERNPSLGGAGTANAGYILGIVGLALYGILVLVWLVAVAAVS